MVLSISGPALSADEPPVRVPMSSADTRSDSKHDFVEVWVVLSEPALATLPRDAVEERVALRERILRQQNDVMAQLAAPRRNRVRANTAGVECDRGPIAGCCTSEC